MKKLIYLFALISFFATALNNGTLSFDSVDDYVLIDSTLFLERHFNDDPDEYFNGELVDLSIWNVVLTKNQPLDYITTRVIRAESDITAYYNFDEITNGVLVDQSASGNNGVMFTSGCTDSLATNYDFSATIDDGSCYLEVYEVNPNINIYGQGWAGQTSIVKELTAEGGFRARFSTKMGRQQIHADNWSEVRVGSLQYPSSTGAWTYLFNFAEGNGEWLNLYYGGGMNFTPQNCAVINSWAQTYGGTPYQRTNGHYIFSPNELTLFLNQTVTLQAHERFKRGNQGYFSDYTQDYSFNMEPIQSDYGTITTEPVPDESITITDNGITISDELFNATSDYARVAKAVIRLHTGVGSFNDIDGDETNNLVKLSPTENSCTFEVGPLQDNIYGAYEIWIGDINRTSSNLRKYKINDIQTDSYYNPSDVLAVNENGNVTVTWAKNSYIPTTELIYYVDRGLLNGDGESINWNSEDDSDVAYRYMYNGKDNIYSNTTNGAVGLAADGSHTEFSYIDYTASTDKNYIYRIRTAGATDNVYYDALDKNDTTLMVLSTGAGIEFPKIYLPSSPAVSQCGSVELSWDDLGLSNSTAFDASENGLAAYTWENLKYTISSPDAELANPIYQGGAFSQVIPLTSDTQFGEKQFNIFVEATRSDGKTFVTLFPTIIPGNRIPIPEEVDNFSGESTSTAYLLSWDSLSTSVNEDLIYVEYSSTNGSVSTDVALNSSSLIANIATCEDVSFTISTKNCVGTSYPNESEPQTIIGTYAPSVTNTFIHQGNLIVEESFKTLEVSAGEYDNRVELNWSNNNNSAVSNFEILRRAVSDDIEIEFQKVGETSRDIHTYTDLYAEANQLYEYQILAKFACVSEVSGSNDVSSYQSSNTSVGFRAPTSSIHGLITYEEGLPVENIGVTVNTGDAFLNKSIQFNGATHIKLEKVFEGQDASAFSLMTWFNPDLSNTQSQTLVAKKSSESTTANDLYVRIDPETKQLYISKDDSTTVEMSMSINSARVLSEAWQHLAIVCNTNADSLKMFLDGVLVLDTLISLSFDETDDILFGTSNITNSSLSYPLVGYIDEISIWNEVLSDEFVALNFDKYFSNTEDNIIAYYHCDEGAGDSIYDISKALNGVYNKNNSFVNEVSFSTNTASQNQIGYKSETDLLGYYSVKGIRFNGTGSNFQVTPSKEVVYSSNSDSIVLEPAHEFNPPYMPAFLGDGIDYLANYNFTDVSSFDVQGMVYYLDPNSTNPCSYSENGYLTGCTTTISKSDGSYTTTLGVEGASVLIDNEPVYDGYGNTVYTDSEGYFSIQVPIGRHQISVEMDDHEFVNQVWDSENHVSIVVNENTEDAETHKVFNFTENQQGLTFYDQSVRILVGRVCGGTTQATKVYGNNASYNNIGEAEFTLTNTGVEAHSIAIATDAETGEYSVNLLPLDYQIKSDISNGTLFEVPTNTNVTDYFLDDTGNGQPYAFPIINMSAKGVLYDYQQSFYDAIISHEAINEIGKEMIYLDDDTIETQFIADSVLSVYYYLIANPDSIFIDGTTEDDYTLYPYLFGENSHDLIVDAYSKFEYDRAENFVYRVLPTISTYTSLYDHDSNEETSEVEIFGEANWLIVNQEWDGNAWIDGEEMTIPNIKEISDLTYQYRFNYPIFKKNTEYQLKTSIQEIYTKYTSEGLSVNTDYVAVKTGQLNINDGVLSNTYDVSEEQTAVPFLPLVVNTSLNEEASFLQNYTLTYTEGVTTVEENNTYYVFGSRPDEGTTFLSTGPDVVEMILRDPPGDASYSYIESGSFSSEEISIYSIGDVVSDHIVKEIDLGTEISMSFFVGPSITTEIILNTQIDLLVESVEDETAVSVVETSYSEQYQTSGNDFNIGSGGDLYIAKNYNILYGTNKYLEIVDTAICDNQGIICLGETSESPADIGESEGLTVLYTNDTIATGPISYTLGTSVGLDIVPIGFRTKTVYDQNHIVNALIPTLRWIRNTYFGMDAIYVLEDINNPCYDNEGHVDYNNNEACGDLNLYPCYTYNETMDVSDPYELPFNAFENIDLSDYIPPAFISMVNQYMNDSQDGSGNFNGFSDESIETFNLIAQSVKAGASALDAIDEFISEPFWDDLTDIIGGKNILYGIEAFKETMYDDYEDAFLLADGLTDLQQFISNISHTIPKDKVAFYNQQIRLWEASVALNERDKISIIANASQEVSIPTCSNTNLYPSAANLVVSRPMSSFSSSIVGTNTTGGPDENISFSAGNTIEVTTTSFESESEIISLNFTIEGEIAFEIGGKINGLGGSYNDIIPISFGLKREETSTSGSNVTFGYVLSDDDESDFISVDVKESKMGFGPIFRKRGGQTMCPHEQEDFFIYLDPDNYPIVEQLNGVFADATQPREVPGIDIEPKSLSNVPEMEQAVFTLSLINNSGAMQDMVYTLMLDEASNPYGAIVFMDGLSVYRDIMVPYGQTITKTITVAKGPEHLDYNVHSEMNADSSYTEIDNRLSLIFRSSCQYNYGTSNTPDIADTISFGVSFLPGCTALDINKPVNNWVLNKSSELTDGGSTTNELLIEIDDYNYNYYSLEDIVLQYKKSNQPEAAYSTQTLATFKKLDEDELLSEDDTVNTVLVGGSVSVSWDMYGLDDGDYDIRAYTDCSVASEETTVYSGHKDSRLPEPFGSPLPADGVLDPNDELMLTWSENIDENTFYSSQTDITVTGIKNSGEVRHDAFVYLDTSDVLNIPTGVNIQNKSFTVEMWIKPETAGVLFEQGYAEGEQIVLSLTSDKKLQANYLGANSVSASSVTALSWSDWHHVAFVFDNDSKTMSFITNGTLSDIGDVQSFNSDYAGEGALNLGDTYQGAMHDVRIWSTNKFATQIYAFMLQRLSGTETGLQGYWAMDELTGDPQDKARSRHINGDVNWAVDAIGKGYNFSHTTEVLNADFGTIAYEQTSNFTIELWFKTTATNQVILSNGSYNLAESIGNFNAWSIGLNSEGSIEVNHNLTDLNSTVLLTTESLFNDNKWHHLSLIKNAKSTTTLYVDDVEQASISSEFTNGFASPQLTLGAKSYRNSAAFEYSEHYTGLLDEVRIWNMSRSVSQIDRFKHIRLEGNEIGLDVYYPFEDYALSSGVALISSDLSDMADTLHLASGTAFESDDLPLIQMHNPVESILFNRLANGDQTLIDITEDLVNIEGCVVDVSMENISDLYANNSEPISWAFFMNKNQLIWDEQVITKEKLLGESLVFETYIVNQGGTVEDFEISNLPTWLTAIPSDGLLEPNSFEIIEFIVNEDLFIGDYTEDITLTGNNDYAERMEFNLTVEAPSPVYSLDPNDFEYTMNFMGKVSVDGIRSRDEKDVLFAYIGEDLRGATELIYIEDYDAYFVFFSVYSNSTSNELINFRLWDASEGKIQTQIMVNESNSISFEDGVVVGSFTELTHFEATNILRQEIPLNTGWNWVSFNLDATDTASVNHLLIPTVTTALTEANISNFKSQTAYAQYIAVEGVGQNWFGSLDELSVTDMFMLKISQKDTIIYEGQALLPHEIPLSISSGWNWIGYLGQRILGINEALSSLNPSTGDVVKSKTAFSMYANESLGWLGSLSNMQGGQGYMLRSTDSGTITYPEISMYGGGSYRLDNNHYTNDFWKVATGKYENSMSIIARIEHEDYQQPNTENLLGAFAEIECVGNITATRINAEESLYFITVYGEDASDVRFDYYDVAKEKIYRADNLLSFEANKLVGTLENPYPIIIAVEEQDLEVFFDLTVYPNPFADVFDLAFSLEESAEVEMQIFDVMGHFVKTISKQNLNSGTHKLQIDGEDLTKGVYFIEVIIGEDSYKKMIIKS